LQQLAEEIARDEIAHVDFLREVLRDAAVPCPKIDIGGAFAAAADAATGMKLHPAFDPYANDVYFLHAGFIFEDVGVTAYRGAVEPLTALVEPPVLSAAAAVLAVEAYHAGAIRALLRELPLAGKHTPYGSVEDVVGAISDLRDAADGAEDLDQGIVDAHGRTNIVPTDGNALVFQRSVEQVLAIVYLGAQPGGFFPEGVSGFFGPQPDSY
jgi:Ferritin-like domain